MNENAILGQLKQGHLRPCYLLLGNDRRAKERLFCAIRDAAVEPEFQDLAVVGFDGETASAAEIIEAVATAPFLGERRVVRVRRFDALSADDQAVLAEALVDGHPGTVVVLEAEAVDKRRKAIELLLSNVTEVSLAVPEGDRLVSWVRGEAERLGLRLHPLAARHLIARAGTDAGALLMEIEKLRSFVDSGDVDVETVEEVAASGVVEAEQFAIFRLCDAACEGRAATALQLLDQLLAAGQSPIYINVMLARHFRLLLAFKGMEGNPPTEIARQLGLRGARFGHEKMVRQAASLSRGDIEAAIELLLDADLKLKRSALPRPTIERVVVRLATRHFALSDPENEKTG